MNSHDDTWAGCWEEHGTRIDDELSVAIRVGVIDVEGRLTVAISVADATPIAVTERTAAGIGELMQWAQEEHEMLYEQRQQRRAESAKDAFDMALLTRGQWQAILRTINDAGSDRLAEDAAAKLRDAAPRDWTGEAAEKSHTEITDIGQATAWLDDIETQLSEIATQVQELRRRLPAP